MAINSYNRCLDIVRWMNGNLKPRSKVEVQPTRPPKKVQPPAAQTEDSRRLHTEVYDERERDFGQTYKRINLYLNKNALA